MKRLTFLLNAVAAMSLLSGCAESQPEIVSNIADHDSEHAAVVFENDYVKATEFTLKPGEKLPLHKGGPRAVYSLSDYKIKWTEGGETTEKEWKQGDAHWHDAIDHAVENIGDGEAHFLVVTRQENALPETGHEGHDHSEDAAASEKGYSKVIFENDHVRVMKADIPAEAAQESHDGINRLIYSLNDYEIKYKSDKAETQDKKFAAGSVHWHEADEHSVENIGSTQAQFLIFAFKK